MYVSGKEMEAMMTMEERITAIVESGYGGHTHRQSQTQPASGGSRLASPRRSGLQASGSGRSRLGVDRRSQLGRER